MTYIYIYIDLAVHTECNDMCILTGTTASGLSEPGSNGNNGVL